MALVLRILRCIFPNLDYDFSNEPLTSYTPERRSGRGGKMCNSIPVATGVTSSHNKPPAPREWG